VISVLIVDDNPQNLYLLRALLQGHGYAVDEAHNGAEALTRARQAPPNLIISDLLMPVMDGYTLLRQWKADERLRTIPFVVYTATYTEPKDERLALDFGADAFIVKPVEPELFQARIEEVLAKKARDELPPTKATQGDEVGLLKEYSEVLIHKLEKKLFQLEQVNRALEEDIARRKQAEAELLEARRELEDIFQAIGHPTMIMGVEHSILAVNKAFIEVSGKSLNEVLNTKCYELVHKSNEPPQRCPAETLLESRSAATAEMEMEVLGRYYLVSCTPVFGEEGKIRKIIHIATDITERKKSEDAVRESETRYRSLFEESMDAVYVTSRDGVLLDANPSFFGIFGYNREDIVGGDIRLVYVNPSDRDGFIRKIEKSGAVRDYPLKMKRSDGKELDCLLTSHVRRAGDGTIVGYQGILRDITEQANLQKQLLQAQKMEAIGTLAGGIAHDFNNLLQAILGYSDLLRMKMPPEDPDRKKLEVIQHAARDGADLVSRILMFSRKAESRMRPLELNEEIRRVEKLLRRILPRMIQIDLVLAQDLRIIDADPAQIEQVLLNLGVNAQHAMPDGGQLLIKTNNVSLSDEYLRKHLGARPGHFALLTVSDTGVGMEPDVLDRIFEPFFTTKTNAGGTGLGLSMVHGIVSQHGGYIRCYSERGRGTSFKIYFPVSASENISDLATTREMPAFGTETILLVDDDDRVREMGRQMIQMGGYKVLVARSGEEALETYMSYRSEIALIVLDLIMPGMGGSRCLEELMRIDPASAVLVASGYSEDGLRIGERVPGARGFISKPYDAKDILIAIRKVLDKGHL
jgi:PAS domain S-box-containing protein